MLNHASHVSPNFADAPARKDRSPRPARRARSLAAAVVLSGLLSSIAVLPAGAESLPTACDKVASPAGSDSASGSPAAPLRTAGALVAALAPGQVGCLHAGTYAGGLRVSHGGSPGAPIVVRSYPGERAQITGRVYVPAGSDYVTIENVSLDGNFQSGERLPSPTINANHVTFESDDVTNDHTGICFDVGSATWGFADSTVIAHDRIHDCGAPSTNQQHGIYVQDATNTQITANVIVDNADRGIQLYPNSTGAVITSNVIANNGEGVIFSGEGATSSSGNLLEHNLIVNSQIRRDVESWYPSGTPQGVGNLVRANCVSTRGIDTSSGGFSAQGNVTASSGELLATSGGGDAAASGSACAAVLGGSVSGVEGVPSAGAPTPAGKEAGAGATPARQPAAASSAAASSQAAPVAGPAATPAALSAAARPAGRGSRSRAAHAHRGRHARSHKRVRPKAKRHGAVGHHGH